MPPGFASSPPSPSRLEGRTEKGEAVQAVRAATARRSPSRCPRSSGPATARPAWSSRAVPGLRPVAWHPRQEAGLQAHVQGAADLRGRQGRALDRGARGRQAGRSGHPDRGGDERRLAPAGTDDSGPSTGLVVVALVLGAAGVSGRSRSAGGGGVSDASPRRRSTMRSSSPARVSVNTRLACRAGAPRGRRTPPPGRGRWRAGWSGAPRGPGTRVP